VRGEAPVRRVPTQELRDEMAAMPEPAAVAAALAALV
jgi:hypothetical protein